MENREGHCLKWSPTVDYSKPKQLFSRRRWRLILLSNKFSIFLHELSPFHKHNTTRLCCICAFGCECIGVDCIKILISLFKRPTMLHWWCTYLSRGHKFEVPWAGHISSQEGFKFSFQLNLPNLIQIKPLSLPLSLSLSLTLSIFLSHSFHCYHFFYNSDYLSLSPLFSLFLSLDYLTLPITFYFFTSLSLFLSLSLTVPTLLSL